MAQYGLRVFYIPAEKEVANTSSPENDALRALVQESGILTSKDVAFIQLVEMGLCSFRDLKDGTLNFRDVMMLLEYARIKGAYTSWKIQRAELASKQAYG